MKNLKRYNIKMLKSILVITLITSLSGCTGKKYTSKDGEIIFSQSSNIEENPSLLGINVLPLEIGYNVCMPTTDFAPENSHLSMQSYPNINTKQYNRIFKNKGNYDFYIHPIICEDKVFKIDTSNATITAYNRKLNGKVSKNWSLSPLSIFETNGLFVANARLQDDNIYISTNNGWVIKVDINTKSVVWKKQYKTGFAASPTINNGKIFLISTSDDVYAISEIDGEEIWRINKEQKTTTSLQTPQVVLYKNAILAGLSSGILLMLDANNGSTIWEAKVLNSKITGNIVELADIDFPPIIVDDVVVAGGIRSSVMGFDLNTGQPIWQIATGLNSYMLHNEQGFAFFVDSDNNNICFYAKNGAIRWIKNGGIGANFEKIPGYLNGGKHSVSRQINRYFDAY